MKRRATSILAATILVLTLTVCAAPYPTVVAYVSTEPEITEWLEGAYAAAHPGETLRAEALAGAAALERLRAERAEPAADVWVGAPSWLLATAAGEDLLASAPPSWAGAVPESMRDADGRWSGWVADPMVLAFNSDRTPRSRAPRDWIDVFHPRWSEDVLLPDPRGSRAMEAFIGTKVALETTGEGDDAPGFDWLARLDANRKAYVTDPDELVRRLGSGEAAVALLPLSLAEAAKESRRPVDFRIPESGAPTLVLGVGTVTGGPHPAAGATFLAWLGTPEVQTGLAERFGWLPAVSGLHGEPAWMTELRPLIRLEVASADTLATHLDGWLSRWRDQVMARLPAPWR
jgi:ABC-type Fe3+ transport system substrate-binding protein